MYNFKKISVNCISDNSIKKESSELEKISNVLKGLKKGFNYVMNNSPATVVQRLQNSTPKQVMQSLFGPRNAPKVTPTRTVASGGFGAPAAAPGQAPVGGGGAQNSPQRTIASIRRKRKAKIIANKNPNNQPQAAQVVQPQTPPSGASGWIANNPLLALGGAGLAGAATGYMLAPSPEQQPYIPPYYYPGRF